MKSPRAHERKKTMTEATSTYYTIHEFMTDLLGLRGSNLLIYALIYSFSKDGNGEFRGSREYLARSAGVSPRTVDSVLSLLCDKGYIVKLEHPSLHTKYAYRTSYDKIERASRRRAERSKRRG